MLMAKLQTLLVVYLCGITVVKVAFAGIFGTATKNMFEVLNAFVTPRRLSAISRRQVRWVP